MFVPSSVFADAVARADVEEQLRAASGCRVRVTLSPRCEWHSQGASWVGRLWRRQIVGAFSLAAQPPYAATSGAAQVAALVKLLVPTPTWVFAQELRGLSPVLRLSGLRCPLLFDINDVPHRWQIRKVLRAAEWRGEYLRLLWVPQLIRAERRALRLAHLTFTCSASDANYLSRLFGAKRVVPVPNAIDGPEAMPGAPGPPRLLFLGNMDYPPNAVSARHLLSRIWPIVRSAVPEAELWIAGPLSDRLSASDARVGGVRLLGYIENLDELYSKVRIAACPIIAGAGTRVKIVEAASHGRAIVSTALGAEGLEFEDGSEIVLRDKPHLFADACIRILRDDNLALSLGRAAQAKAKELYSRRASIQSIERALARVGL